MTAEIVAGEDTRHESGINSVLGCAFFFHYFRWPESDFLSLTSKDDYKWQQWT